MEFIKTLKKNSGRNCGFGTAIIADGNIFIRIPNSNIEIKDVGIIKNGIGVVVEPTTKERKSRFLFTQRQFESNDIPVELQGEKYRFSIPAEKLSDTEYVFMFKKAKMLNKK